MQSEKRVLGFLDFILNAGSKDSDEIQKIRLIRQINGLNLFYTMVAGSVSIIFIVMKASLLLSMIQIVATFLYFLSIVISSKGHYKAAAYMTIYFFEAHMLSVMLLTNAWHSPAVNLILLYPLLAALLEVPIFTHLFMGIAQALALFGIHKFLHPWEDYLIKISGINGLADEVLKIMAYTYTPAMAAVIIAIIFGENMRARKKQKDMLRTISDANTQLEVYANQLKDETQRLKAEVSIAKKIQTMVLPSDSEIRNVTDLDIACLMRTANEVGGDYYDIIKIDDSVTIAVGDVTGHGLSSGLIMLMAQTSVRTLAEMRLQTPEEYLSILNKVLYANITRIKENRSMTMLLMTYKNNKFTISGQHESVIICRKNGEIEVIDTLDNGFYIGMTLDVECGFKSVDVKLEADDVMFLYSDGVTEAENESKIQFGQERLCEVLKKYHKLPAENIKNKFMKDLYNYMGETEIYDDITIAVIKQK